MVVIATNFKKHTTAYNAVTFANADLKSEVV